MSLAVVFFSVLCLAVRGLSSTPSLDEFTLRVAARQVPLQLAPHVCKQTLPHFGRDNLNLY